MKKFLFLFLLLPFLSFKNSTNKNADGIIGNWMNEENNLQVEVFKNGDEYKARVVWFDDTDDKSKPIAIRCDEKNPDKNLRSRKIIGTEVMNGLLYNADDDEWQGGKIYDCSTGKNWNAKAWINSDGILKVRGYWHLSIFGQNMSFKKV